MSEIKKVAIYLRLSRDEENKGIDEILDNHRSKLIELCEHNGWQFEIYEEIASSVNMNRPRLNQMLDAVSEKKFDGVVVKDIDRLSRNEFDASDIRKILFKNGCAIITPEKIYDWTKSEDMLLLGIKTFLAAQEYVLIRERLRDGKLSASKKGMFVHGTPPLGYDKDSETRKLVPNKDAEHVQYIFHSIVNGKTISEIMHELNKWGVKTSAGNKFHFNAVLRILNNPQYRGALTYNRYMVTDEFRPNSNKHKSKERPKHEWLYEEGAHTAIVDKETWYKANEIANTYKFARKRSDVKTYPTSKLIYCANCETKQQGVQWYERLNKLYIKICPVCKNRAYIYEPILRQIKEEIAQYRQGLLNAIEIIQDTNVIDETEYKKKQLETQINKVKRAMERIELLFEEGEIEDINDYRKRKAERKNQLDELNRDLSKLEQETPKTKLFDLSTTVTKVDYLLDNWEILDGDGLTNEEINLGLQSFIEKIYWKYSKDDEQPSLSIKFK